MEKDSHIDTLRGLAIFLVVIYHVLGVLEFPVNGPGHSAFWYRKLSRRQMNLLLWVLIGGIVLKELIFFQVLDGGLFSTFGVLGVAFGLAGTTYVINLKVKNSLFIFVGSYAYPIYLIHTFAEALIAPFKH